MVSTLVTIIASTLVYVRGRAELNAKVDSVHDELVRDRIPLRMKPYADFMRQLAPLSRQRLEAWRHQRHLAAEHVSIFNDAVYGEVGLLASSDTRELILAARAACIQFSEWKIPIGRLQNRVWAIHQALRSDLGIKQPNWPDEIERRRLQRQAGDDAAIDAIVDSAVHMTYGLYGPDTPRPCSLTPKVSFTALVLDMDGLMLDSELVEKKAWQKAATDFGCSISDAEFILLVGRTEADVREILTEIWSNRSQPTDSFPEILATKNGYAASMEVPAKEGLRELLTWASTEHLPVAVGSSSKRQKVFDRLGAVGVLNDVDVIVGGDEVSNGKPHPDIFALAARRLHVASSSCLVLEDSDSGIRAASAAGMASILVPDTSIPRIIPTDVTALASTQAASLLDVLKLFRIATSRP
ncbi:HAD family hydrolase [Catellatospora citrea]|uniref:HAD family hydrolase n=1 Tax=Catellatospora citrea TaxID=53366 RepID=UPI001477580A|nr:HAD family phosphatase [Catellatospora citrea]